MTNFRVPCHRTPRAPLPGSGLVEPGTAAAVAAFTAFADALALAERATGSHAAS